MARASGISYSTVRVSGADARKVAWRVSVPRCQLSSAGNGVMSVLDSYRVNPLQVGGVIAIGREGARALTHGRIARPQAVGRAEHGRLVGASV
jgi:hypothetical protein